MSEDVGRLPSEIEATSEVGPDVDEADQVMPSGDGMLNLLVRFVEMGSEYGLTLYTSGQAFTGVLISQRKYLEGMRDGLSGSALATMFEEFLKYSPEAELAPEDPTPDYRMLHLRDGQIIAPGQFGMPQEGMLLRIERAAIVGWSLGQLRAAQR